MASLLVTVLYTFLQWIYLGVVQPIQRNLNSWKRRLGNLMRHANLTTQRHMKSNKEIFEDLKSDSEWGPFFRREKYELQIHDSRIGEGTQAEVFEATGTVWGGRESSMLAVKIYKEGHSLLSLQTLWPRGLVKVAIQHDRLKVNNLNKFLCLPLAAMVLEDDRFAFVFPRYGGDLRRLINSRIRKGNNGSPFSPCYTWSILHKIAKGMEMLHNLGFLHRDLKASNVLYPRGEHKNWYASFIPDLHITDFESSVHTVGTGFWRAPEILLQLKDKNSPLTCTRQTDVYSYAMTCYEVITGYIPLGDHKLGDYDFVINGNRPTLPKDICPRISNLVMSCWDKDSHKRPTFHEIVRELESIGQYEQRKKKRKFDRLDFRVDTINVVLKNEQNRKSLRKESCLPTALNSPQNAGVRHELRKASMSREKTMNRRRREKEGVCSFTFQPLTRSLSLDEENLPSSERR